MFPKFMIMKCAIYKSINNKQLFQCDFVFSWNRMCSGLQKLNNPSSMVIKNILLPNAALV